MKKVFLAAAMVALMASPVMAFTVGEAGNVQGQDQGMFISTGPGYLSTDYGEVQGGLGGSTTFGAEGQIQTQGVHGTIVYGGAVHNYDYDCTTGGESYFGTPGFHVEGTEFMAGATTGNDQWGMASYGNQGMYDLQGSTTLGIADVGTAVKGFSSFTSDNYGYTSEIHTSGGMGINAATGDGGSVEVLQETEVAALNNGSGTAMSGGTGSYSSINAVGNAGGEAAAGTAYSQDAAWGMFSQSASGYSASSVAE
jgi:hypothetical protein